MSEHAFSELTIVHAPGVIVAGCAEEEDMAHLGEEIRGQISLAFEHLESPVRLLMFTKKEDCEFCEVVQEISGELASLAEQLTVDVLDIEDDAAEAERHGVDKVPALVLLGKEDYGLRYYGVPSGHEFPTLIESIVDVSRGPAEMPQEIMDVLAKVDEPVRIEVLSTPT